MQDLSETFTLHLKKMKVEDEEVGEEENEDDLADNVQGTRSTPEHACRRFLHTVLFSPLLPPLWDGGGWVGVTVSHNNKPVVADFKDSSVALLLQHTRPC